VQFPESFARARAALVLLAACALAPATADAATPSLLWTDARQVAVRCLVQSNSTSDAAAVETSLCARVRDLASRASPYPVMRAEAGDPALVSPGTVTLLVHASVERAGGGRLVAFTLRPYRATEGGDIPFGTAPRAIQLRSASLTPAVDTALGEALAEILPWQRPSGLVARPL
jgi:hypothetical protein